MWCCIIISSPDIKVKHKGVISYQHEQKKKTTRQVENPFIISLRYYMLVQCQLLTNEKIRMIAINN
jgi:hypothetical protein